MTNKNRKIIFGLGNTLNRDEGIGVYAVKALENPRTSRLPYTSTGLTIIR